MNEKNLKLTAAAVLTVAALAVCAAGAKGDAVKNVSSKNAEGTVTTNENGSVSRTFTESTITTNGNMVTEHRRETRTDMDTDGNVLTTSTSEYAQSYSVGDTGMTPLSALSGSKADHPAANADSFMGLKFGEEFKGNTNFVEDADEPTLLRTSFKPAKPLDGFDDYYVYVTPRTHKVAKVYACAKNAIDPGSRWRRHYLIQALEKRYGTWARLCSFRRPCYAFDIGPDRYVTACLAGSSPDYETVVCAWDSALESIAAKEREELREAARKTEAERRTRRMNAAAESF